MSIRILPEIERTMSIADRTPAFYDFKFQGVVPPEIVDARACGDCSLCCKLLNIDAEIGPSIAKPPGVWCKHCRPGKGGCAIYADRPEVCVSFLCGWRQLPLGEHWHPRSSGMVVNIRNDCVSVSVDSGARDRWRADPWYSDLLRLAALFFHSGKFVLVYPNSQRADSNSWVLDHMGGMLPPLELPSGYNAASICMLPVMRIHRTHTKQWKADREYVSEPYSGFRKAVQEAGDKQGHMLAAQSGMRLAMELVFQRLEERGWKLDAQQREVVRAA